MFTCRALLNFLVPSLCLSCQAQIPPPGCCQDCQALLPWLEDSCRCCAKPLAEKGLCGSCSFHPPVFHQVIVPFVYMPPISHWLSAFKFHEQISHGQFLAACLWAKCQQRYRCQAWPELIIPVPLHAKRLRERGYNQALMIAAKIAKWSRIPLARHSLVKIRATRPQTELRKTERQKNLKKAFLIAKPIKARHVALVDDVLTTGATVKEITRILRRHGVLQVDVWCVARAI